MPTTNPSVDGYIRKNKAWQAELTALRHILLDGGLVEDVKWRVPCYTLNDTNVAFIGPLKDCCVLSFVQGALLKDPAKVLVQQTENSQSVRVIRFKNAGEIEAMAGTLRNYVAEAVNNARHGRKVVLKKIDEHAVPAELQAKFDSDTEFETAFRSLTPGRQRGYLLHIGSAKQSKTRLARIEKVTPRILEGKGLDD